ncbi:MAG: hypothetical protein AAF654_08730 [Myxococcota bacterium]
MLRSLKLATVAFAFAGCSATATPSTPEVAPAASPEMVKLHNLEPTFTRRTLDGVHKVYLLKRKDGGYITKVCLKYQETGSHIWRNSCRRNVSRSISLMNPLQMPSVSGYVIGQVGQNPQVHTNAVIAERVARLERAYNYAVNGRVVISDLKEGEVIKLEEEVPDGVNVDVNKTKEGPV